MVILSLDGLGKAILNLIMQWTGKKSWFAISHIRFSLCDSFIVKIQSSMFPALCVWRFTFWKRSNKLSVSCISLVSMWSSLFHGLLKSPSIIGFLCHQVELLSNLGKCQRKPRQCFQFACDVKWCLV